MKKRLFLFLAAAVLTLTSCSVPSENGDDERLQTETVENVERIETDSTAETQQEGDSGMMEQIWQIEDPDELVWALGDHIAQKCQYGDDMSALTEPERVLFITQTLEMEVNNGGFSQFFYNTGGNFSGELVSAFTKIGAVKTAGICQRAISAYGVELLSDRAARQDILEEYETDEVSEILDACDMAFYAYEEDLNELNYQYVMNNREFFS